MFDRVSRLAERAAVGLSRRAFLSSLGRIGVSAMAFATLVGTTAAKGPGQGFVCVKNGGCCGGAYPYYGRPNKFFTYGCYKDANCSAGRSALCFSSPACCGGTGSCVTKADGTWTCYSDPNCNVPC